MGMVKEFKEFAMKGSVVDMAVGIIIGGAFGTIVKSLVDDVLMPPIGLLLGGGRFFKLIYCPQGRCHSCSALCRPGGCQGRGCSGDQLWPFSECGNHFSNRCICSIHAHTQYQFAQAPGRGTSSRADHQRLPVLPVDDSDQGKPLPQLHLRASKSRRVKTTALIFRKRSAYVNRILIGNGEVPVHLLANYGNRHGMIAGATGTSKTISLMVLTEGFSRLGVPVFMANINGDVDGLAMAGDLCWMSHYLN